MKILVIAAVLTAAAQPALAQEGAAGHRNWQIAESCRSDAVACLGGFVRYRDGSIDRIVGTARQHQRLPGTITVDELLYSTAGEFLSRQIILPGMDGWDQALSEWLARYG